jgi:hypothetical protein
VGRASVELVFDNSMGRIGGAWAAYSEISVKRVLTREGDSSYYLNGQHVRRRDVQDIFLGTGLGPRAYSIIEQGMISRVITSKPEEPARVPGGGRGRIEIPRAPPRDRAPARGHAGRTWRAWATSRPSSRRSWSTWRSRRRWPRATRTCRRSSR